MGTLNIPDPLAQFQALKKLVDHKTAAERDAIAECIRTIDAVVDEYGELGLIALALVGIMKQFEQSHNEEG